MTKWMKRVIYHAVLLLLFFVCFSTPIEGHADSKLVSASLSDRTVKVGQSIKIDSKTEEISFKSSDTTIAHVNENGVIVGKKEGKASITVSKESYQSKAFEVMVIANGKMASLPAAYSEIKLTNFMLQTGENGDEPFIKADIRNKSKTGKIDSVEYVYEITNLQGEEEASESETEQEKGFEDIAEPEETSEPEAAEEPEKERPDIRKVTKKVILKSGSIEAGKSASVTCEGPVSGDENDVKLIKIRIFAGDGLLVYNPIKDTSAYIWGKEDKTPPVLTGMLGENSYNRNEIFMVVYPDKKYDFQKYISASDDRDRFVSVYADTSKVNWKKSGIYNIPFTAADKAGNTAKKNAKVEVRTIGTIERMADSVLKSICRESWSDQKKAEAIYTYVRKHFSYADSNEHSSWEASASKGMRYKSGNCFVFYSAAKLLLTRSGIPNLTITRSQGHGRHWWNLVYIRDGWYHFDTTPRRISAVFCLVTDSQLSEYSRRGGNSHIWNHSLYPKTAVKKISEIKWGRKW